MLTICVCNDDKYRVTRSNRAKVTTVAGPFDTRQDAAIAAAAARQPGEQVGRRLGFMRVAPAAGKSASTAPPEAHNAPTKQAAPTALDVLDLTVKRIRPYIDESDDERFLDLMVRLEKAGRKRKSVLKYLRDRLFYLSTRSVVVRRRTT